MTSAPGEGPARGPLCRFCAHPLHHTFVDLGMSPLCESYVSPAKINHMEPFYPLRVWVCERCFLVQLEEYVSPEEIFTDYAYFSSFSTSWVLHARNYVEMASERFSLGPHSRVVEIASNDGYLLQHFVKRGIPVLGIEPAKNVAEVALERGIPTEVCFFGTETAQRLAEERGRADLIVGNNVLAHVPNLNDFVAGMKILLAPQGVITMEFPHLMPLIAERQFDTIYHEHFSYFSLLTVRQVFTAHQLAVFDVEELPTHGGSLRIYASHADSSPVVVAPSVRELLEREQEQGLGQLESYTSFGRQCEEVKWALLELLISLKRAGASIAGYGAPGKGNTLLNYCGIRTDLLDYTVDRNPYKQGLFLPGTHIPIYHPDVLTASRPAYILILPWNLKEEIAEQLSYTAQWGARFIVPIPDPVVFS